MFDKDNKEKTKKNSAFSRLFSSKKDSSLDLDEYEKAFLDSGDDDTTIKESQSDIVEETNDDYQYTLDEQNPDVIGATQTITYEENAQDDTIFASVDSVEINSGDAKVDEEIPDANTTAEFTFKKDLPEGSEVSDEPINVTELEKDAKSYFDATHNDDIEEKVKELSRLADGGFDYNETYSEFDEEEHIELPERNKNKSQKEQNFDFEESQNEKDFSDDDDTDELDKNISRAFGLTDDDDDEFSSKYESLLEENDEPEIEYTDRAQEKTILKALRKDAISRFFLMIATLCATALCIYFETASGTSRIHPSFFEAGRYGLVYSLSMLQIMFLCAIFNLSGIIEGFKGLSKKKANSQSVAVMTGLVCTLHTLLSLTFAHASSNMKSFCSAGCLSILLLSISSFIKSYMALSSFCIAASKSPKFSTTPLSHSSLEAAAFSKYLDSDTEIFTVEKGNFVKDFFKNTYSTPEASRVSFRIYMTSLIAGLIVGIAYGIFAKDIYGGICAGCAVSLSALPANLIISTSLPFLFASLKVRKTQTAFIGEASPDKYTNAGIISFDDTEVFPAQSVKVSSIRTYSGTRIDKVIIYMAKIFSKLEGSLSYVFQKSIQGGENEVGEASIIEHAPDGVRVRIDGNDIILGNANFLKLYGVHTPSDNIDESFLQSLGSIMYMAIGNELSAKFYIKYAINKGFEEILRSLYDSGICAGIKSMDPCINTQLVCGNLRGTNYPVSVIKQPKGTEVSDKTKDEVSGSIISLSGTHNFLKSFITLDRLRNTYRSNALVSSISSILCLILCTAICFMNSAFAIGVSFFLGLQALWCLPTVLFSIFNK